MTSDLHSGHASKAAILQIRLENDELMDGVTVQLTPLSANRLAIVSYVRIPTGASVTVEAEDVMFLCEVVACTQSIGDVWHAELAVEQVLTSLQSLMNLRSRLLEGAGASLSQRVGEESRR